MSVVKAAARRVVPSRHRHALYRARRVGFRKYATYARIERAARRRAQPRAGEAFEVGPGASIVVHDSTLTGVRAHWVDRGEGIKELEAFRRLAPGHETFLDIGAAEGIFSAAFCALTGSTAHAFEPAEGFISRIRDLMAVNPAFDLVPHQLALGSSPGTVGVRHNGQMVFAVEGGGDSTMEVDTLDDFVAARGITPDFAKVDVEGMEIGVLRGGRKTFASSIDTLLLEVHRDLIRPWGSVSDIAAITAEIGYAPFTLDLEPIPDLRRYLERQRGFRDVLNVVLRW